MDIFDQSDSAESQPTQLLQHALTKQKSIVEPIDKWGLKHECEQEQDDRDFITNFSIDSMIIPPARGSASRYQLNWLAPTQTQPQVLHREEEIVEEGSQKENDTPASNRNKHENVARTRSSSPQASSSKPVNVKGSHVDYLSHPDSRTASGIGRANVPKSVSFQSPRSERLAQPLLQPTKSLPMAPSRRQRSPSPPSQDSFGGEVSQDPAANYIAQATQVFDVPLSDLGRTTVDLAVDHLMDHSSKSQEEDGDSWMNKIRRAYEQSKASEASGSILVARTPSHSGSEGSSQNTNFPHPDASQLLNDEDSLESLEAQRNRYGVQANASQSSLIVPEDELSEEKKPAAILEEFVPTQPSTPLDNTATSAMEDLYVPTLRSRSARATLGTTSSPAPRNFLSLIRPEQRERRLRQMLGKGAGTAPPPVSNRAAMQSFEPQTPNDHAETQPPSSVAAGPSYLLSENNDAPPPVRQVPFYRPRLLQPEYDNLDIVPDSEPPVPSATTPTGDIRPNESPTKRLFHPISPMSELSSGEIVPDSMEVHESSQDPEGDVPLAALLQVKSAAKSTATPASGEMRSSVIPPSIPPPPVLVKKVTGLSFLSCRLS
ncbi:hypothetical protein BDR04DRAFT_455611 [Suillus decipiens]|nr:hypothetical protein BDR04DRAFT_455611 [Suillus decipiens]